MNRNKNYHNKELYRDDYCRHDEDSKAYLYTNVFSIKNDISKIPYHTKNQFSTPIAFYGGFAIESPIIDPLENEFKALSMKWQSETGFYSTSVQKVNDTYLEIIAKGRNVIPYIIKEMEKGGSVHWHIALKAITGVNPVPIEKMNQSKEVKRAWVEWGKKNNFIS